MPYPQPYFRGLTVQATWDGVISHAVDLDITVNIDAIPNSRLRLISLELASHADMTGVNENSPVTTYTGEAGISFTQEAQGRQSDRNYTATRLITELDLDAPCQRVHASRIPLSSTKSRSLSPQKRPLPIPQRSPWRLPAFEDVTNSSRRSYRADESKNTVPRRAHESCTATKPPPENVKFLDTTRWARELLRAEVSRKASCQALSEQKTADGTPEQKVTEWLDQNEHETVTSPSIMHEFGPKHPGDDRPSSASSVTDAIDEKEQFPPSPTPSSQAIVPWTSVRYRNPLRLRGAGSCAASLEKFNGYLYAVFPLDVMQVVHQVHVHAKAYLRKDYENGGHLLELPGLPRQDNTEGCFTLSIVGDDEGGYPAHKKIAHVDKDFGTDVLTCPHMDSPFNADAPFSTRLLCFEDGVRVLMEADFEVVYDVQTLFSRSTPGSATPDAVAYKHVMVCSLRLRDFLIWADLLQIKLFISGGQVSVLQTQSVINNHDIQIGGEAGDDHEREVTVTMKAAEITRPFGFIFEGTLENPHWVPSVSKSRQLAQDRRAQRDNNTDVQDLRSEYFVEQELKISDVIRIYRIAGDIPLRTEGSPQLRRNACSPKYLRRCCNTGGVVTLLLVVYLLACYVTGQFGNDRQLVVYAQRRIMHTWTDPAAAIAELFLGNQIDFEQDTHQHIEGKMHQPTQDQPHAPIEINLDVPRDQADAEQQPARGLSLRDRIDRALGWKGPTEDW
jgi:hypothetical protein